MCVYAVPGEGLGLPCALGSLVAAAALSDPGHPLSWKQLLIPWSLKRIWCSHIVPFKKLRILGLKARSEMSFEPSPRPSLRAGVTLRLHGEPGPPIPSPGFFLLQGAADIHAHFTAV